jgi:hypothetical protein
MRLRDSGVAKIIEDAAAAAYKSAIPAKLTSSTPVLPFVRERSLTVNG